MIRFQIPDMTCGACVRRVTRAVVVVRPHEDVARPVRVEVTVDVDGRLVRADDRTRGLPETPSELFAYDALILSNVPSEVLSDLYGTPVEVIRARGRIIVVGLPDHAHEGHEHAPHHDGADH